MSMARVSSYQWMEPKLGERVFLDSITVVIGDVEIDAIARCGL